MIIANGKIKKHAICSNCFAKVTWDNPEDEHTHGSGRYIICPNCHAHIELDSQVTEEETAVVANPTATINGRAATITDIARPAAGSTVKLTKDTVIPSSAPAAARFGLLKEGSTIDLNGKTLETAGSFTLASGAKVAEIKGGTIKAAAGTTASTLINANGGKTKTGKIILTDVIVEGPVVNVLQANNGAELVLNNVTITAPGNDKTQSGVGIDVESGAKVTAKNVTIHAKEAAIWNTKGNSNISVIKGTLDAENNAVVMTNGIAGHGKNTITLDGVTINAQKPASDGYIACGVYVANDDTVDIKNSTINATEGVGMVIRGGQVTVDENTTIVATGEGTGFVGDSKKSITMGKQIIVDKKSEYPAVNTISVSAEGKEIIEL